MQGLNIHNMVGTALQCVTPTQPVIIYAFAGQTKDSDANWIPSYTEINTTARVQLENKQNLRHIESINATTIARRFYISINSLSGLNRNLSNGGDYLLFDGLYYKIVEVPYNFQTGWFCVVGIQTTGLGL